MNQLARLEATAVKYNAYCDIARRAYHMGICPWINPEIVEQMERAITDHAMRHGMKFGRKDRTRTFEHLMDLTRIVVLAQMICRALCVQVPRNLPEFEIPNRYHLMDTMSEVPVQSQHEVVHVTWHELVMRRAGVLVVMNDEFVFWFTEDREIEPHWRRRDGED
jgi:hypothetical protein